MLVKQSAIESDGHHSTISVGLAVKVTRPDGVETLGVIARVYEDNYAMIAYVDSDGQRKDAMAHVPDA